MGRGRTQLPELPGAPVPDPAFLMTHPWFGLRLAAFILGIACRILAPVHFRHHRRQKLSKWVEKETGGNLRNTTSEVNKGPPSSHSLLRKFVSSITVAHPRSECHQGSKQRFKGTGGAPSLQPPPAPSRPARHSPGSISHTRL